VLSRHGGSRNRKIDFSSERRVLTRRGYEMRPRGLKPALVWELYAALEAPLFHGAANVPRGARAFDGAPNVPPVPRPNGTPNAPRLPVHFGGAPNIPRGARAFGGARFCCGRYCRSRAKLRCIETCAAAGAGSSSAVRATDSSAMRRASGKGRRSARMRAACRSWFASSAVAWT